MPADVTWTYTLAVTGGLLGGALTTVLLAGIVRRWGWQRG